MEKIPHYINDPKINAETAPELKLFRPKINYILALLCFIGILSAAYAGAILITVITWNNDLNHNLDTMITNANNIYIYCLLGVILLSLRYIFIWFVRLYQHYAKSETRLRCCMTPSCSEYAILAFKKYGAIIGSIKTVKRLLRCKPPGGIDYP
ncbi:MAG: membrane protein insertion efficiency factor YidD [Fermentimonas sp.]|jgi:putative membrane protein insertion efficiency factor|nr:membrane protein insertion efficiency factor YidD [Methanocorpusculum sp.]